MCSAPRDSTFRDTASHSGDEVNSSPGRLRSGESGVLALSADMGSIGSLNQLLEHRVRPRGPGRVWKHNSASECSVGCCLWQFAGAATSLPLRRVHRNGKTFKGGGARSGKVCCSRVELRSGEKYRVATSHLRMSCRTWLQRRHPKQGTTRAQCQCHQAPVTWHWHLYGHNSIRA